MLPTITLFGKTIGTYAIMAIIGMLVAGVLFCYMVRKNGQDDNDAIIFLLVVGMGILVGSHILYGITNIQHFDLIFKCRDIKTLVGLLAILFGGSVFYGGLIGGGIAGLVFIKIQKPDKVLYSDLMGIVTPLFHGSARIGCFLGGCCYGIECRFGFVAQGNELVPELNGVSRFPVQLVESICNFGICLLIWLLFRKNKLKGRLFFVYLMIYAVVRFLDEYLRGDAIRGFWGGMSTSQIISIGIEIFAICGIILVTRIQKRALENKDIQHE